MIALTISMPLLRSARTAFPLDTFACDITSSMSFASIPVSSTWSTTPYPASNQFMELTSCCSTDSERPHHCCHLLNNFAPPHAGYSLYFIMSPQNCSFQWEIQTPHNTWFLVHTKSTPQSDGMPWRKSLRWVTENISMNWPVLMVDYFTQHLTMYIPYYLRITDYHGKQLWPDQSTVITVVKQNNAKLQKRHYASGE